MPSKVWMLSSLLAVGFYLPVYSASAQDQLSPIAQPVEASQVSYQLPIAGVPAMAPGSHGGWKFSADLLFVQPTGMDSYFVIDAPNATSVPSGRRINNDPQFQAAFRLGAAYEFVNSPGQFQVTWTRLDTDNSTLVTGDNLWATIGAAGLVSLFESYTGTANANLDITHNRIDALFTEPLNLCSVDLGLQFGFEYADVSVNESYLYDSPSFFATELYRSQMRGIGPEMGLIVGYDLLCGDDCGDGRLSFTMNSTGSLLLATAKASTYQQYPGGDGAPDNVISVEDDSIARIIPALHIGVGLNYDKCVCGRKVRLSSGYEVNNYFNAISRTAYPDDVADGLMITQYQDFGLQGLYFSCVVGF